MIRHLFLLALSTCVLEPIANACNSYCGIGCSRYSLGKCRYCKAGWHGSYCQKKNVALHGNASQQGTYSTAYARRAVDGNTNNDYDKGSCTHSDERNNSWWSVQLGDNGVNQIKYMKIYNRKEPAANVWRRKGMEILIDGKRCKKWPDNVIPNITENVTCNETLTGHNLTITVRGQFFSLCEVQVFVCSDGWFGKDCDKRCNCRSLKDVCDKVTGRCPRGCQAGYTGVDCQTPCTAGRYGHGCSEKCGHCANNHVCDKTTGQCPSCVDGWRGKRCDLCRNGRYGHGCSEECGHCAKNDTCDMTNGHCPSCAAGWGGLKCNVCRDSIYGQDCSEECGHCANNQACDKLTGHCPSCADGWTGEKCDVCRDGRYGTDCASCGHCANNQACDKTTGHCLDTCDDGWQGNKCDERSTNFPVLAVVTTAVVTLLLVLLSVAGVLLCLFGQQRLQWVKNSTKKTAQVTREGMEMSVTERQPADVITHAYSGGHDKSNYAVLDTALMATDENNYEVIKQKVYQNT